MSLIGKSIGNYRIIAKIGEGGMGSVYLGEHPLIGKRVAVKVLHEELSSKEDVVSRFFTEARAVNAIGHPNIVDVVDYGKMKDDDTGEDVVYFVMEFLDGEALNARLKREGLTLQEALHVADQCAAALAASHEKGIIHRDLKPENIFLIRRGDQQNYVKLLDFGIAKLTGGDAGLAQHKTRTGLVIGTPSYMSPEQCDGKGNIDWRADIYSLGIVLYEMLTGQVPFPGDGFGEVLVAHLTKPAPVPSSIRPEIPPAIEAIVMHAIEKRKERRFQSMDELRAAVRDPEAHALRYTPGQRSGNTGETGMNAITGASVTGQPTMLLGEAPQIPGPPAGHIQARGGDTLALDPGQAAQLTGGRVTAVGGAPRSTTLSGASGEVAGGGQRPRSRAPLFATLGAVVGLGVLGVYFFVLPRMKGPSVTVSSAPVAVVEPKKDEAVHVSIETRPPGAKVFRAGHAEPVGTTPFSLEVKKNEPDFDVLIKLDGYKEETKTVATQRDHDLLIALSKVEPPPATPVAKDGEPAEKPEARVARETKKEHKHSSSSSSKKKTTKTNSTDNDGTLEPTF